MSRREGERVIDGELKKGVKQTVNDAFDEVDL
jgi:hypothetical protein